MATSTPDGEGFCPVLKPKNHKKAKTTPSGAPQVKPEVEMDLRILSSSLKIPAGNFSQRSKSNS